MMTLAAMTLLSAEPPPAPFALAWRQLAAIPGTVGLAASVAGISADGLLAAGGANFPDKPLWDGGTKTWHAAAYALSHPGGAWQTAGELPRPLAYAACMTTTKGVVCAGGSDALRHHADVNLLVLNDGHLQCTALPPLPHPLANACGAVWEDTLFVAGGELAPQATAAVNGGWMLKLEDAAPVWQALPPWPGAGRTLAAAAAADGKFYVMGGVSLAAGPEGKPVRGYLQDAYCFTPHQGWRRLACLPRAACAAPSPAPFIAGRYLLVLGGDDGSKTGFQPIQRHPGFATDALAYDIAQDRWLAAGQMPVAHVTAPLVRWGDSFVVVNGEVKPGVRSPEVWAFSVMSRPQVP